MVKIRLATQHKSYNVKYKWKTCLGWEDTADIWQNGWNKKRKVLQWCLKRVPSAHVRPQTRSYYGYPTQPKQSLCETDKNS